MLKSYAATYDNGILNWLDIKPSLTKARVIVIFEEADISENACQSTKKLKGIVRKPERAISLKEMDTAIQLKGAKL